MRDVHHQILSNRYNNIYFGSDCHYNHDRPWIYGDRGFKDISSHDEWLRNQLFSLKPNDLLILLGDNTLNSTYEGTLEWFQNIPAIKYIIWGDHSSYDYRIYQRIIEFIFKKHNIPVHDTPARSMDMYPLSIQSKSIKFKLPYKDGTIPQLADDCVPIYDFGLTTNPAYDMVFFGNDAIFSISDRVTPSQKAPKQLVHCRHQAPLIPPKHCWSLHGHSHGNLPWSSPTEYEYGQRLDVGIDNSRKYNSSAFFSWKDVQNIMNKKKPLHLDHHVH